MASININIDSNGVCVCVCVCVWGKRMKNKGKERIKETKKREELECVGGVISCKITGAGTVHTGVAVVSISISLSIQ